MVNVITCEKDIIRKGVKQKIEILFIFYVTSNSFYFMTILALYKLILLLKQIMDYIFSLNETEFTTKFSSDRFMFYVKKSLQNSFEDEYTISDIECDDGDKIHPTDSVKKWSIRLYTYDKPNISSYLKESLYVVPSYEVQITYNDCMTRIGHNIVYFDDCSNTRTNLCHNAISVIKYFIKKSEKNMTERYAAREDMLAFINGAIVNYDDFTSEDLLQIRHDKTVSKKRNVLEDPMWIREVLQYVDIIPIVKKHRKTTII